MYKFIYYNIPCATLEIFNDGAGGGSFKRGFTA